jgi:hypothetical protein
MANGTLQYCLRESKRRPAGHEAFAQIMARLSELRSKREETERNAEKTEQKGG